MDGPYLEKGYLSLDIEECQFWVNQGSANTEEEFFSFETKFLWNFAIEGSH